MASRSLHLFAGPSLGELTPERLGKEGIVLHPPAKRGDVETLVATNPHATIAIADGVFHQQPAVGHVEIRDAIRQGAVVWGLCSMGAIRAAEMKHLGMLGFGQVFAAFCADPSLPDDEVALLHSPQPPYLALSEPLIHWRSLLNGMQESGRIDPLANQRIQAELSSRWYGSRTMEHVLTLLSEIASVDIEEHAMELELDSHRVKILDLAEFIRARPWDVPTPAERLKSKAPTADRSPLDAFGGLPFVDKNFRPTHFLSAVAGRRAGLVGSSHFDSSAYADLLDPTRAVRLLTDRLAEPGFMPDHAELTSAESEWAAKALCRVRENSVRLSELFNLPVKVLRWKSPKVSMTNPFIPQTVFLGEGALQSTFGMLEEVWVHEFAHIWLGMLCELSDLQKPASPQSFTLPSGTGPKDARGVLLAAHFAAAVASYLRDSATRMPLIGRRLERMQYVRWYLKRSLETPIFDDLTSTGLAVHERLAAFSEFEERGALCQQSSC